MIRLGVGMAGNGGAPIIPVPGGSREHANTTHDVSTGEVLLVAGGVVGFVLLLVLLAFLLSWWRER